MRRPAALFAALLTLAVALAPALAVGLAVGPAWARAGDGLSLGSRGTRSFIAPPSTNTAPFGVAPLQRSLTPPPAPGYPQPNYGQPNYAQPNYAQPGYGRRAPFLSGLVGGLLGAGLGGMLFGRGLFGGITGVGGVFGLLIQLLLIGWAVRWVYRRLFGQPAFAAGSLFNGVGTPAAPPPRPLPLSAPPATPPLAIGPPDYQAFEQTLKAVQQAWSNHDVAALRTIASPEMVSYFAEQLSEQTSRGVRNFVTDVRLDQGDLAEAWSEGGRDYATVAMRFSMLDVTRDQAGQVVDGSLTERVSATEIWTFLRVRGGRWVLSAIQQAR